MHRGLQPRTLGPEVRSQVGTRRLDGQDEPSRGPAGRRAPADPQRGMAEPSTSRTCASGAKRACRASMLGVADSPSDGKAELLLSRTERRDHGPNDDPDESGVPSDRAVVHQPCPPSRRGGDPGTDESELKAADTQAVISPARDRNVPAAAGKYQPCRSGDRMVRTASWLRCADQLDSSTSIGICIHRLTNRPRRISSGSVAGDTTAGRMNSSTRSCASPASTSHRPVPETSFPTA